MKPVNLEDISFAQFADAVETTFRVERESGKTTELRLVAADSRPTGARTGLEQFSLLFRGPADRPLMQRLYVTAHDRIGQFDLFIVPTGKDEGGYEYEAVFNRAIRKETDPP